VRCPALCSFYMRYCDCTSGDRLIQVIFGKFRSRYCPQCFGTGPSDQGGTRHGDGLPGESVSYQMEGESRHSGVQCPLCGYPSGCVPNAPPVTVCHTVKIGLLFFKKKLKTIS
jgi:hypothetical protein